MCKKPLLTLAAVTLLGIPAVLVVAPKPAHSQETAEGISGAIDKKRRSPVLTVETKGVTDEATGVQTQKIIVDAYVPNSEYADYPIKFDFYVNRKLFVSQTRSKELPGAIGVDIGTDIATPPFNYQIVATLLHPNRQFVTVAQGAIYASDIASTLNCSFTEGSDATSTPFTKDGITIAQSGPESVSITFTGTNTAGDTKEVAATATFVGGVATGNISLDATEIPVTGTVTKSSSGSVQSLALSAVDATTPVSLDCSAAAETSAATDSSDGSSDGSTDTSDSSLDSVFPDSSVVDPTPAPIDISALGQ